MCLVISLPVVSSTAPVVDVRRAAVSDRDWHDWRWQLRHMISGEAALARLVTLSPRERAGLAAAAGLFKVGITPYYASLMDPTNDACPKIGRAHV